MGRFAVCISVEVSMSGVIEVEATSADQARELALRQAPEISMELDDCRPDPEDYSVCWVEAEGERAS